MTELDSVDASYDFFFLYLCEWLVKCLIYRTCVGIKTRQWNDVMSLQRHEGVCVLLVIENKGLVKYHVSLFFQLLVSLSCLALKVSFVES